jgi:anaerobic magnesium-protoporphyrin IX monomethyl ester cyclase
MESHQTEYQLKAGRLSLLVNISNPSVNIYWNGAQITRHCGLIAIIGGKRLRRYYSPHAACKLESISENQASILLSWPLFSVKQRWRIVLEEEKVIGWNIQIMPRKRTALAEKEAGILLSPDYTNWINSYEEGYFSEIRPGQESWQDVRLWNLSSKSIGVRSSAKDNNFMPAVILDYDGVKENTEPKIRNSDYESNARGLLAQVKTHVPLKKYYPGKLYEIFSGKIKIMDDEKLVEQHVLDCKKRLYHERLPFMEEKMLVSYLSKVLKPVDVLLVNLPWKAGDRWGVRAGSRWPHIKTREESAYLPFPFFLAYAASVLLKHGISVRVIDAIAEGMEQDDFIALANELEPALLIVEVSTPSLQNDVNILKNISKKNMKIAVCGLDFNISQPGFLLQNDFIDFAMTGEYEYTALELYDCIKAGEGFEKIQGLVFRENNSIKINPARTLIKDLDILPWPLREQLPMEKYIDAPGNIPLPSVQMWASRGCPFQCTFCAWPQLMYGGNRYRMRHPKAIVDEMEYLIKERGFKSVYFDDDSFNINRKGVLDFCRELEDRHIDVPWAIMARADTMDEEMLMNMRRMGLCAVKYGVESAEQELVDNVCKKIDLKQAERMISFTKSLGIKIHLTFAFGLPGETEQTIKRTIDYAVKLNPDTVQFSIMTPYPGTAYYNQLSAKGHIISKDWSDYDGASKSVIKTESLSGRDLEKAKDMALTAWKRHKRKSKSFIAVLFDKKLRQAFRRDSKSKGILTTLFKAIRYVFNV